MPDSKIPSPGDMVLGTPHLEQPPMPTPRMGDMVLGFQPSTYQKAIFDWLKSGSGSCVVCAVPGSGKTTTLIKGANHIPKSRKSRFLAFNKHIASELEIKLLKHIKASTIHSLGLSSIVRRYRGTPEIDKRKYSDIVTQYLIDHNVNNPQLRADYRKRIIQIVKLTQLTLTNPYDSNALKQLCHHYGILTSGDWEFVQKAVGEILDEGVSAAREIISYDDMVWLPNVLSMPIYTYDFLCVDEAQDLNRAQLELILKAQNNGARGIFVGDRYQAIMGFAAADHRSIDNIISSTSAIQLPLSICYRCPTSHIELANKIYPVIEPRPNAPTGVVSTISKRDIPSLAKVGDLIICRCFYPLVNTYLDLLGAGIPAKLRNKDMGEQLFNIIEQVFGTESKEYTTTSFTSILQNWYSTQKSEMIKAGASLLAVAALHDKIRALNAIYKGGKSSNIGELKQSIDQMCLMAENVVKLTTIHGAKGLEANRVFHLEPNLVPHPKAEKPWEKEQEKNLEFVALTRAKHELFFAR